MGLLSNRVPAVWSAASYPSLKPMRSYFSDLLQRLAFFKGWYEEGQPAIFWLPAFFFPQSFLTGVLQTAARKRHVPVDCLSHHCRVLKLSQDTIEQQPPPNEGVYVRGLFLAGARWDSQRQTLAEQKPKILWEEMPVLWLNPKSAGDQVDQAEEDRQDTYTCPLYRTSERHGILS